MAQSPRSLRPGRSQGWVGVLDGPQAALGCPGKALKALATVPRSSEGIPLAQGSAGAECTQPCSALQLRAEGVHGAGWAAAEPGTLRPERQDKDSLSFPASVGPQGHSAGGDYPRPRIRSRLVEGVFHPGL